MTVDVDRFDALRRAWINTHRGWSTIQDRRQNRLDVQLRRRQRLVTGAVPDPHDDTTLPPIWLRAPKTPASKLEWVAVNLAALIAPLGWPAGWALSRAVTRMVPGTLRAYPTVFLLSAGGLLGLLVVALYNPGDSLTAALLGAWIPLQVAATPVVAGIYGVLDGWLAIPGSTAWWPLTPRETELSAGEADEILGSYDLTGPGLVDPVPLTDDKESRPR